MLLTGASAVVPAFEVQVAVVVGIAALDDFFPLVEQKHAIDHVVVALGSRNELVVEQACPGSADDAQPASAQAQTKIDVLVSGKVMRVETPHLPEERGSG